VFPGTLIGPLTDTLETIAVVQICRRRVTVSRGAGLSEAAISVAAADHEPGTDPANEPPRKGSDKVRDLSIGAASGGVLLGTLAGLASLAIPGLGVLLVGGIA